MSAVTLDELLTETVAAAGRREREAFDAIAGGGAETVLFGAGQLGRKALTALRRRGIEPRAFADNEAGLHGTQVEGIPVLAPVEAARRFGAEATFVVTIFRGAGDGGMQARENSLRSLGCRRIANFLPLAWKCGFDLLPHYGAERPSLLLAAAAELAVVGALWGDAASRQAFCAQLQWRLRADFSALPPPSPDQYLPHGLFELRPDEAVVDGGACDGDTLRAWGPGFAKAWAIEPDPANAARLRGLEDPRISVLEYALGDRPTEAAFAAGRGMASAISPEGGLRVRVETLDRLLEGQSPTFLKLDVEGAEQRALRGAARLLARTRPVVAACVYHRPDDLWKVPLFLHGVMPEHRLFLRAHQNDGFELVVYAIPPERNR